MSEPSSVAPRAVELLPGLRHWTVHDDRIDFRSEAYAVASAEGTVLVDPLPLAREALDALRPIVAVCCTGGFHLRSAWRLRSTLRVPVHLPEGARGLEDTPEFRFRGGDALPGGLRAVDAPGPTVPHFAFVLDGGGAGRVLFCGDAVMRGDAGPFRLVPEEHHDDPARTRRTVAMLRALEPVVLCPAHGAPLLAGAAGALEEALRGSSA